MPTLMMMIGFPGSGKSTWRESARQRHSALVGSSDDYIEAYANEVGKTYNEVFKEAIKNAELHVKAQAHYAIKNDINFIWDQTNLNTKTRRARLAMFPTSWKKNAIVISCSNFEEWKKRLMSRPGKIIPAPVIQTMMKGYEEPTLEEGFHSIMRFDTATIKVAA